VNATGSEVLVGTASLSAGCLPINGTKGTVLEFGHGGPPDSPIPDALLRVVRINGISLTELSGAQNFRGIPPESYLLAFLDGWQNWLLFAAPGSDLSRSLITARSILGTIHTVSGSARDQVEPAKKESFIGQWGVHDGGLKIVSGSSAEMSYRSGCVSEASTDQCVTEEDLQTTLSADRSRLTARVQKVVLLDTNAAGVTTKVVNPRAASIPAVGETSIFAFAARGLLIQTTPNPTPDDDSFGFGNPYWCSYANQPAAVQRVDYCGA
jgi:hypothetical protein